MWYELSRLGLREQGRAVEESHKFKEGVLWVRERLMELCIFNPKPYVSFASEEEWDHHFREVIQLDENADQSHLEFLTVLPNPDDGGGMPQGAAGFMRMLRGSEIFGASIFAESWRIQTIVPYGQ
jgi:hypothetical protein